MTDPYFGYNSADNAKIQGLKEAQTYGYGSGNGMYYPEADTSANGEYNPTINWSDGRYSSHNGSDVKDEYTQQAGNDTIEKIWLRMHTQVAEQVDILEDQWFQVSMVIENLRDTITHAAVKLSNNWTGNAAAAFLARGPGAAAKSLDDWYNCAIVNSLGMLYLSNTIRDYQAKIDVLYQQYQADMVKFSGQWTEQHSWQYVGRGGRVKVDGDPKELHSQQYLTDLRSHAETWNVKARDLQYQMAQGYWQVVNQHLAGSISTIFEGPTDAIVPDPKYLFPVNVPNIPNIPNLPNVPNVPDLPTVPALPDPTNLLVNVPTVPDVPNLPVGLTEVTVPPVPLVDPALHPDVSVPDVNAPNLDPSLIAGLAANPALLAQLPEGMPNVGGAPGGLGGLNGLGRGMGMPPMGPKLKKGTLGRPSGTPEGEGGAGRSPMSPNTLRNKAGRPGEQRPMVPGEEEEFGRPSGLSSAPPVLRGRSATGGRRPTFPEEGMNRSEAPLRPGSAPPVLNRKRQNGPGQQASGPIGPVDDDTLRPGQPGTSAPVLRGSRLGHGGPPEETEPPARALRGGARRPAGVTEPEMASRRKSMDAKRDEEKARVEREYEKIRQLLNDEEPWKVATPGGAVLDNAPERPTYQVEPKPTLRGGSTG